MAFRWWTDSGPRLDAGWEATLINFSKTVVEKKMYRQKKNVYSLKSCT